MVTAVFGVHWEDISRLLCRPMRTMTFERPLLLVPFDYDVSPPSRRLRMHVCPLRYRTLVATHQRDRTCKVHAPTWT